MKACPNNVLHSSSYNYYSVGQIDLKNEFNPVVVHCSSGIERTSVVIAIGNILAFVL